MSEQHRPGDPDRPRDDASRSADEVTAADDPAPSAAEPGTPGADPVRDARRDGDASRGHAAAGTPPAQPARPGRRGGGFALLLALAALGAAGYLWWEHQQLREAFATLQAGIDDDAATARLDALEARIDDLDDALAVRAAPDERIGEHDTRLDGLAERLDAQDQRVDTIADELEDWPLRFAALREALDAAAGVSDDARRRWQLADAEHLLNIAHAAATVSHDATRAAQALRLADDRVRGLGDPELLPVREAIGDALAALAARPAAERQAAVEKLGELDGAIEALPLADRPRRPAERAADTALAEAEPGLSRAWLATRQALARVVSVRRDDDATESAITATDAAALRRTLALHVADARLALLRRDDDTYRAHLASARSWLDRWFDDEDRAVASFGDDLDTLSALESADALPPLTVPLERLRDYAREREAAR